MKKKFLILGLGNILMGDEGVGVRCIEYLKKQNLPTHADLLDGGTGGFHLLSYFQEYRRMIIIDATIGNGPPGELRKLKPAFAADFPRTLTSHDIGLRDLVQSAELLETLPEIDLICISIKDGNTMGMGISKGLEGILPRIYKEVLEIIQKDASE